MFYEVLVLSDGGERFTIERDAPLAAGERFSNESEFYRVLAIEPGHGPFVGVIQAERLRPRDQATLLRPDGPGGEAEH